MKILIAVHRTRGNDARQRAGTGWAYCLPASAAAESAGEGATKGLRWLESGDGELGGAGVGADAV